jgi:hypothetical protein
MKRALFIKDTRWNTLNEKSFSYLYRCMFRGAGLLLLYRGLYEPPSWWRFQRVAVLLGIIITISNTVSTPNSNYFFDRHKKAPVKGLVGGLWQSILV